MGIGSTAVPRGMLQVSNSGSSEIWVVGSPDTSHSECITLGVSSSFEVYPRGYSVGRDGNDNFFLDRDEPLGTQNLRILTTIPEGRTAVGKVNPHVYDVVSAGRKFWGRLAMSYYGDVVVAADVDNDSGYGGVYVSWDYGESWFTTSPSDSWTYVAASSTGQYISATSNGEYNSGQIIRSFDYGQTWNYAGGIPATEVYFCYISMSADGRIQAAIADVYDDDISDYYSCVYVSSDYGATWTCTKQELGAYHYLSIAVSGDGTTVVVPWPYGGTGWDVTAITSTNSGVSWTDNVIELMPNTGALEMSGVSISYYGEYISICGYWGTEWPTSNNSSWRWDSSNFGVNWTRVGFDGSWMHCDTLMSSDGQYRWYVASSDSGGGGWVGTHYPTGNYIFWSEDFGVNWVRTEYGFQLYGGAMSGDGAYAIFNGAKNDDDAYGLGYSTGSLWWASFLPAARIHIESQTTASFSAPLKFDVGELMTTPEDGVFEYSSASLYFTKGSTRCDLLTGGNGTSAQLAFWNSGSLSGTVNLTWSPDSQRLSALSPLADAHVATKEYVDDSLVSGSFWSRITSPARIYPSLVTDKVSVGYAFANQGSSFGVWGNAAIGNSACIKTPPTDGLLVDGSVGIGQLRTFWTQLSPATSVNDYKYLAIDATGLHIVVPMYFGSCLISHDSGTSFSTAPNINTTTKTAAVSSNATYIAVTTGGVGIWRSSNGGTSFSLVYPNGVTNGAYTTIAMSEDGKYWLTGGSNDSSQYNGGLWVSSDYGATWTLVSSSKNEDWTATSNASFKSCAVSGDGKYMFAKKSGGKIWVSNNYGAVGSWSEIAFPSNGGGSVISLNIWGAAASYNGSFMVASGVCNIGAINRDVILTSSNYGATGTWSFVYIATPSVGGCELGMSADGSKILVAFDPSTILASNDNGSTWTSETIGSSGFHGLAVSADGSVAVYCYSNVYLSSFRPTAHLHLEGVTTTAGSAPLKFSRGTVMTIAEDGCFEYDATTLYFTKNSTRFDLLTGGGGVWSRDTVNGYLYPTTITDKVGVGTASPDRLLHAEVSDAVTNATSYAARLSHITSGTAAASFGTGIEFELESAGGTNRVVSTIESILKTATNAAEDGAIVFKNMIGGVAAAEVMRIEKGNVGIGTNAPTQLLDVRGNITLSGSGQVKGILDPTLNQDAATKIYVDGLIQYAMSGTAGGDLSGSYPNPSVAKIQGLNVTSSLPSNGQVLTWNSGTSNWEPQTPSGSSGGSAGGDLTGSYPNPTISSAYTAFVMSGTAGGDLSGSYPNPSVIALRGFGISTVSPLDGQSLVWNSGSSFWEPISISGSGATGGHHVFSAFAGLSPGSNSPSAESVGISEQESNSIKMSAYLNYPVVSGSLTASLYGISTVGVRQIKYDIILTSVEGRYKSSTGITNNLQTGDLIEFEVKTNSEFNFSGSYIEPAQVHVQAKLY
jgi:hypothetical protein